MIIDITLSTQEVQYDEESEVNVVLSPEYIWKKLEEFESSRNLLRPCVLDVTVCVDDTAPHWERYELSMKSSLTDICDKVIQDIYSALPENADEIIQQIRDMACSSNPKSATKI